MFAFKSNDSIYCEFDKSDEIDALYVKTDKPGFNFDIEELSDRLTPFYKRNLLSPLTQGNFKKCWSIKGLINKIQFKKNKLGVDFHPDWTLTGSLTGYWRLKPTACSGEILYSHPDFGKLVPIIGEADIVFSMLLGAHRCGVYSQLSFYDQEKNLIGTAEDRVPEWAFGGRGRADFYNQSFKSTPPEGAAFFTISLMVDSYKDDMSGFDAYVFFAQMKLALIKGETDSPTCQMMGYKSELDYVSARDYLDRDSQLYQVTMTREAEHIGGTTVGVYKNDDTTPVPGSEFHWGGVPEFSAQLEQGPYRDKVCATLYDFEEHCNEIEQFFAVDLYIDGVLCERAFVQEVVEDMSLIFKAPRDYFDGRVHHIELRNGRGDMLDQRVELLPCAGTDFSFMQEHTMPPFNAAMSPLAAKRYLGLERLLAKQEALSAEMGAEMGADQGLAYLTQAYRCHQALVNGPKRHADYAPLDFPQVKNPTVSVIIPVHNKIELTYFCLQSLAFAPQQVPFEIIVVDDGSSDVTAQLSRFVSGIKIIRHEQAQGFILACNRGVKEAAGDYVFLLNNDTEVTTGALDELVAAFDNFDRVGLVGSKLIYPDGRLQESGGIIFENGDPWNYGRDGNAHDPKYNYTRQVDYVSGAAMMVLKSVWNQVGGFSEEFAPAYFEDTDMALKVQEAGLKTLIVPSSVIVHHEGGSNGVDTSSGMKRYQEVNRPKFKAKWKKNFKGKGVPEDGIDALKDRNISGRVLFIDHEYPRYDMDAGSFAAIQEIRAVQALGYKVTFLPRNLAYLGKYVDSLQQMGVEALYVPFIISVQDYLRDHGQCYDAVYITRYSVAIDILDDIRKYMPQAKILFCNADLHFLREMRAMAINNQPERKAEVEDIKRAELQVMSSVDVVLSYSDVEHELIRQHGGDQINIKKCPWVVEVPSQVPSYGDRKDIVFFGGYGHIPNVEAVNYFITEVWPHVSKALPGVKFKIYGSRIPDSFHEFASDSVEIHGFVEAVEDAYNPHRVFVAPLLSGAGIKGKVISALAYGIPVVMTDIASEGIGCTSGIDSYCVQSPEEWAEKITRLYQDEHHWQTVSSRAQKLIKDNYSFDQAVDLMQSAFESVGIETPKENGNNHFNKLLPY